MPITDSLGPIDNALILHKSDAPVTGTGFGEIAGSVAAVVGPFRSALQGPLTGIFITFGAALTVALTIRVLVADTTTPTTEAFQFTFPINTDIPSPTFLGFDNRLPGDHTALDFARIEYIAGGGTANFFARIATR